MLQLSFVHIAGPDSAKNCFSAIFEQSIEFKFCKRVDVPKQKLTNVTILNNKQSVVAKGDFRKAVWAVV